MWTPIQRTTVYIIKIKQSHICKHESSFFSKRKLFMLQKLANFHSNRKKFSKTALTQDKEDKQKSLDSTTDT